MKKLKLILSASLYEEISILVLADDINDSHKNTNNLNKSYDISKLISERKQKVKDAYNTTIMREDMSAPLKELNKRLAVDPEEIVDEEYIYLNLPLATIWGYTGR